jgi:uncharacterized protein YbjT (DUF2867 family)
MVNKLILVTGATGYIASRLIPQLLERGYRVRALARHPLRLKGRAWFRQVEVVAGDVMVSSSLAAALEGVDTAYYLIHNMSSGRGYTEKELDGAHNFASAAEQAGLRHIIYLGGLADPQAHIAAHMRSRIETGVTLRKYRVPVTEFRAGVIIGPGSLSFEMIRFMTELLPIVPGPTWMKNKSQPIASQNVIDYLLAALDNHNGHGQVFEIGGPDLMVYSQLMLEYARLRGLKRALITLPFIPLSFMSFGVGLTTPVPARIAYALIEGLQSDSRVQEPTAQQTFPTVKLIPFHEAVLSALGKLHPRHLEPVWTDGQHESVRLMHEGFFINHRAVRVDATPATVWRVVTTLGNSLNSYRVESMTVHSRLLLRSKTKNFGDGWLEWQIESDGIGTLLTQTAYFAPRGLMGFIHWHGLYPIHEFFFRRRMREIVRRAQVTV